MPLFSEGKILGIGASSKVVQMTRKSDGAKFAVKILKRDDKENTILFRQEYELLTQLKHPNIITFEDCYMDRKNFYICTTLCKGGELFDRITEIRTFNEVEAAGVMKVIISAIAYCHAKDIVHRDLKPENIVFRDEAQKELVIIDFGEAIKIEENKEHEDFVGTAFYLAPECVRNRRGWELKKSDMWTTGIITFQLLTGTLPFHGRDIQEILKKILRANFSWPKKIKLSICAKDFIVKLLTTSTKDRMSAEKALKHNWLNGSAATDDLGATFLNNLSSYTRASKLKKILVKILSNELSAADHNALKQQFEAMDADGTGLITHEDLANYIFKQGGTILEARQNATKIIYEVDQDGDGKLCAKEFKKAQLSGKLGRDNNLIRKYFRRMDRNNDGFISHAEMFEVFYRELTKELITLMIEEIDQNTDGKISYGEFVYAMKQGKIVKAIKKRKEKTKELTKILVKEVEGGGQNNSIKKEGSHTLNQLKTTSLRLDIELTTQWSRLPIPN